MTRELTKELITPVLIPWSQGAKLQVRYKGEINPWSDVEMDNPDFTRTDLEWREKPTDSQQIRRQWQKEALM